MATVTTKITKEFKDLDLLFLAHPVTKDVTKHKSEMAVINAIKNLVLTNHYERPFQPELGSNVRKLLFENLDFVTSTSIEREIEQVISNFEPRARIYKISVQPNYEENGFTVDMEFSMVNKSNPITIQFFIERVR